MPWFGTKVWSEYVLEMAPKTSNERIAVSGMLLIRLVLYMCTLIEGDCIVKMGVRIPNSHGSVVDGYLTHLIWHTTKITY